MTEYVGEHVEARQRTWMDAVVTPFPQPGPMIREAFHVLAIVRSGDQELIEQIGDLDDLPHPWEPDTCTTPVLHELWAWCDDVVIWINHEYVWRPTGMIPACWPAHPHLARELPALACQRLAAQEALDVTALEEWHRYTLTTFLDRMNGRLGESSCRDGKHAEWPAAPRHTIHKAAASRRRDSQNRPPTTASSVGYPQIEPESPSDSR